MWWRLALATLVGIAIGIAATTARFYLAHAALRDARAERFADWWSSAGKDWSAFSNWLRHGGRRLVETGAFSAAKNGMSEAEVRAAFGPPDLVVVGPELDSYSVVHMRGLGARGAYLYKIGRFAALPNQVTGAAFAIVFNADGKVVHRLGFGVNDDDRLADIDSDTRSERRIVP
jgi:hypothetical protein